MFKYVDYQIEKSEQNSNHFYEGDPISISMIIIALVSGGGALAVSVGKDGFITRLANVLDTYIKRGLEVTVEKQDGEIIHLKGSAKHVESILKDIFLKENDQCERQDASLFMNKIIRR
ncbi:MAG: hypothetical protein U5K72_11420 [Balneolaceae bacterium]|nr:hypothetical protein [Balneolaceae bacterium]